ncbi:MAG TPA: IclR family transcriptional regulator [Actinomycetes bacterium]|nr:IclR family transcriptional regulator [Actinomycetes bacterium]
MGNSSRAGGRPASPVQSVDRAVTVLEILARQGEAGVTEVAAELGVHKSTAFRLVGALENRGLVTQDGERGKYRLGVGILRLAGATTARLDLVQEGRPVAERLAREVAETINLAVLADRTALYLDQVAGPSALQTRNWVGQRTALHATSNGKVLLAYLSAPERRACLAGPLDRYTAHTVVNRADLEAQLREVLQRGYATTVDELEIGLTAVAAPVRNADGSVVAALSASGPGFRLTPERVPEIAGAVRRAADEISRRLGARTGAGLASDPPPAG